jgi:hypothetical protein
MILDALPPDRGLTPFRSGLGSVEGVLVAKRRAGDSQLKRRYSFELLGEVMPCVAPESGAKQGAMLALVYVHDADRWRVPSDTECRDLAGVVDGGDDLVLTTAAGIRWWITEFIDTVDRRVTPASPRLIARLQRRSGLASLRGVQPPDLE